MTLAVQLRNKRSKTLKKRNRGMQRMLQRSKEKWSTRKVALERERKEQRGD